MENVELYSEIYEENEQTLNLSKLSDKISLIFNYEINDNLLGSNDTEMYYTVYPSPDYIQFDYNFFFDNLRPLPKIKISDDPKYAKFNENKFDSEFEEIKDEGNENLYKASFVKRLVSKQKRRYQDTEFDLDMSYITEKVIAMGFPSTGIEVIYRNSLSDIIKFFKTRHNNQVKVYNLCLEKDRIYNKNIFPNGKVGLFPATDHFPCPIKLILEFCIDICLYLAKNPNGVAAVHCKAGKGRTGVMICSYLIFSGLCETSDKAFRYYARVRTKNNTGITIASQRRYIKYFENFLQSNFCRPYIKFIPKIIRSQFSFLIDKKDNIVRVYNILQSFQKEKSYFISPNKFKLKGLRLGPLPKGKELKIKICNFVDNKFKLDKKFLNESKDIDSNGNIFYEKFFKPELIVHSDIMIKIKKKLNFYLWINLWYSTWELIKNDFDKINGTKSEEKKEDEKKEEGKKDDIIFEEEEQEKNDEIKFEEEEQEKKDDNNKIIEKKKLNNSDNKKNKEGDVGNSLNDIIYKLKHNTDLNELINHLIIKKNMKIDRQNMKLTLKATEFDKFKEINDNSNIQMDIFYSLIEC